MSGNHGLVSSFISLFNPSQVILTIDACCDGESINYKMNSSNNCLCAVSYTALVKNIVNAKAVHDTIQIKVYT